MSDAMVAHVRTCSKSTGFAKFLLVLLASHHNDLTGQCNPSLDLLAFELTKSKPYVIKLIAQLVALGELLVVRGNGRTHTNQYEIRLAYELSTDGANDQRNGKPDHVKGKRSGDPLPAERVTPRPERVNGGPEKGHSYVYSKIEREKKERPVARAFDHGAAAPLDLDAWRQRYDQDNVRYGWKT